MAVQSKLGPTAGDRFFPCFWFIFGGPHQGVGVEGAKCLERSILAPPKESGDIWMI